MNTWAWDEFGYKTLDIALGPELSASFCRRGRRRLREIQGTSRAQLRFDRFRGVLRVSGPEAAVQEVQWQVECLGGPRRSVSSAVWAELMRTRMSQDSSGTMHRMQQLSGCRVHIERSVKEVRLFGPKPAVAATAQFLEGLQALCTEKEVELDGISSLNLQQVAQQHCVTITEEGRCTVLGFHFAVDRALQHLRDPKPADSAHAEITAQIAAALAKLATDSSSSTSGDVNAQVEDFDYTSKVEDKEKVGEGANREHGDHSCCSCGATNFCTSCGLPMQGMIMNMGSGMQMQMPMMAASDADAAEGLCGLAQPQQLTRDLCTNNLGSHGARGLAEGLRGPAQLQQLTLDLRMSDLGNAGAQGLANELRSLAQLQQLTLDLCANNLGPDGAQGLADGLRGLTQLQQLTLDLRMNDLGDGGTRALADGLRGMVQLQQLTLDLRMNDLGDDGARGLADELRSLAQLQQLTLDLCANNLGSDGARGLADGLQVLVQLQQLTLDLRMNDLGAAGARALADGLRGLAQLQQLTLDLGANNVIGEASEELRALLNLLPVPKKEIII